MLKTRSSAAEKCITPSAVGRTLESSPVYDFCGHRDQSQGHHTLHSGLSQNGHHIPRHHHAARRCARVPPDGRSVGAAMGRAEKSIRSPASRRAASFLAASTRERQNYPSPSTRAIRLPTRYKDPLFESMRRMLLVFVALLYFRLAATYRILQ
jgi:hypothetical protein